MEYRIGTMSDLDAICDLIRSAIQAMDAAGIHQWDEVYPAREDFEEDIKKNTLYLAILDGQVAALYVISTECDEAYHAWEWEGSDEKACILHRFCVDPRVQNRGVGRQMLAHVEDQLRKMGYESVRLDAFTKNPYALKMYERAGYIERGYADFRMGRFLLMEKTL